MFPIHDKLSELAAKGYEIEKIVATPRLSLRWGYIPVLRSGSNARALYVSDDELAAELGPMQRQIAQMFDVPLELIGMSELHSYCGVPVEYEILPNIILGEE